jgi:hypothetical protein
MYGYGNKTIEIRINEASPDVELGCVEFAGREGVMPVTDCRVGRCRNLVDKSYRVSENSSHPPLSAEYHWKRVTKG